MVHEIEALGIKFYFLWELWLVWMVTVSYLEPIPSSRWCHQKRWWRQLWLGKTPGLSVSPHMKLLCISAMSSPKKRKPEHIYKQHQDDSKTHLIFSFHRSQHVDFYHHNDASSLGPSPRWRQKLLKTGKGQFLHHESKIVPESCSRCHSGLISRASHMGTSRPVSQR